MKALSLWQPWASLIVMGAPVYKQVMHDDGKTSHIELAAFFRKDVENRSWSTDFRGRIYIHAAKRRDNFEECMKYLAGLGISMHSILLLFGKMAPTGSIVGEADLVDCVEESESPWFNGPYGFVFKNPRPYTFLAPCKGRQGFFNVPADVEALIKEKAGQ